MEQQAKMKYIRILCGAKKQQGQSNQIWYIFLLLHKKLQTGWKKLKKLLEKLESGGVRLAGICLKI